MPGANEIGRYRIEQPPLGQGGMGIVYKAFDTVTRRSVALKTLKGSADASSIKLFEKEWTILASLCHPNIVDILDIGELTENGERKPYFVMPLLPGATLDKLIKESGPLLTHMRVIEIISQACRGLQAAHDQRLVHRDLKPSNLFVMADDTVKIIDFGIVHLADNESRTGIKGTLPYMAPEQLELKSATARSDIFSLGVVCYEALTGRKPFDRPTPEEMVEAIRHQMPVPVSDLNPSVNEQLSRTVQKALAKQPYHRFSTTREFAEFLQRSLRDEPIELFDRNRIQPRLNRVKKALRTGDYQLAIDILNELESEGNIDSEISMLRMEGERAMRAKTIQQLLEDARTRMEEQEYPLALQKVQSAIEIDPDNIDGQALRTEIERQRSSAQIERWHQIAQQHLQNGLFTKARQAVDEILKIDQANKPAREMLAEISRCEAELSRLRVEKQRLYDSAYKAYRNGEISSALQLLERVVELGKNIPGQPNTDARYLEFYEQVRRERDEFASAYAEGKRALDAHDCVKALEICNQVLSRRPSEALFQALKIEVEEYQRQQNSAAIANLHSQIEAEIDLQRKFEILKEAVKQFPGEQTFQQSLKLVKERRDLVNSIVARARHYESQGQFIEASNQWEILRSIHKNYPGVEYEIQRLSKKQEEYLNNEAKVRLLEKIENALTARDYTLANELLTVALAEAPENEDLHRLKQQVDQSAESNRRAQILLGEGQSLARAGDYPGALDKLRWARGLEPNNLSLSRALSTILVEFARSLAENDWRAAQSLVEEALEVNPEEPGAAGVSQLIADEQHRERVDDCLEQARELRRQNKLEDAIGHVELALRDSPNETRLLQLRTTLRAALQRNQEVDRTPHYPADASAPQNQEVPNRQPAEQTSNKPFGATSILQNAAQRGDAKVAAPPARLPESRYNNRPKLPNVPISEPGRPASYESRRRRREISDEESGDAFYRLKRFFPAAALVIVVVIALLVGKVYLTSRSGTAAPDSGPTIGPQDTNKAAAPEVTPQPMDQGKRETAQTKSTPSPLKPAPSPLSVYFDSKPVSARVKIDNDDRLICSTPCRLPLSSGQHKLSAFASGYLPATEEFMVPEQRSISVLLSEGLKAVRFISQPANVSFVIDGKMSGQTPKTLRLSVGDHQLTVTQDGQQQESTIHVSNEEFQVVEFRPQQ